MFASVSETIATEKRSHLMCSTIAFNPNKAETRAVACQVMLRYEEVIAKSLSRTFISMEEDLEPFNISDQ